MSDDPASLNPRAISPNLPAAVQPGAAAPAAGPVATTEASLVGQNLDGRYQVVKHLGEGELSIVYEARHGGSGRHFAVKVLRSSFAAKQGALDSFLQHARTAAQVRHDNVVAIEEFGYTPTGSVYAAVELVVGDTLQTICERDGRWSWAQARPIAVQIAAALDAAHRQGVVHHALKPSNCFVIIDPRGKREPFVKVSDFGMAQVGVEASAASAGSTVAALFGEAEYMAPEQGFGGEVGPRSDIYAMGMVLYRLLTGRVPFSNANAFQVLSQHANKPVPPLREIDPQIPEAVEQIVMGCLGKTPEQRYGSAAEVKQALESVPSGAQGEHPGAPAAAAPASGSNPRFAKMSAGGAPGAASQPGGSPPAKRPPVIVAGSIGEPQSGGGISGSIGGGAPPSFVDAPPPPSSEMTSSFLASRPGLRMGLGASLPAPAPGSDDPAPPPTVAPGMAVPTPTMFPGIRAPFAGGLPDGGPSPEPPGQVGSAAPPPLGGYQPSSGSDPSLPPPVGGGYTPPSGPGPGMPGGGGGGYTPPSGPGPGMPSSDGGGYTPPSGPGPGMPGGGGGGYTPPSGPGPGMPGGGGGYTPPSGPGPGMPGGGGGGYTPPSGPGPGMPGGGGGYTPPSGPGPGMPGGGGGYTPPSGPGPGMPGGGGGYTPPSGPGPGMPGGGGGGYTPPSGPGPGMPSSSGPSMPGMARDDAGAIGGMPRGVGPGMPPRDANMPGAGVGPGMPMARGMGPGMPHPTDSGPNAVVPNAVEAPSALGAVEYDEDEQPKRRPLLLVGIAVAVIGGGAGLGWLIVGGDDGPEGDVAKVTRTGKAQDIDVSPDEPEPEPQPEDDDEPVIEKPKPKPKPKAELTFPQSLNTMKGRIRSKCKKLGPGPVNVDTFVAKDGGRAIAPKVKPKGPIGDCALRIVERWNFPASDQDHPVNESVSW